MQEKGEEVSDAKGGEKSKQQWQRQEQKKSGV